MKVSAFPEGLVSLRSLVCMLRPHYRSRFQFLPLASMRFSKPDAFAPRQMSYISYGSAWLPGVAYASTIPLHQAPCCNYHCSLLPCHQRGLARPQAPSLTGLRTIRWWARERGAQRLSFGGMRWRACAKRSHCGRPPQSCPTFSCRQASPRHTLSSRLMKITYRSF